MVEVRHGGSGNDTITAKKSGRWPIKWWESWKIYGKEGDDTLTGGKKNDTIEGGSGDDRLVGLDGNDYIYGEGYDENDNPGNDTIFGGNGHDTLFGQDGNDRLLGGNHNDFLSGGNGNDNMDGESGNDTLSGGLGSDTLNGGSGNDQYIAYVYGSNPGGDLQDVIVESANSGTDTLITNARDFDLHDHVENVEIYAYNGQVNFNGNDLNNNIKSSGSQDTLAGGKGNDTIDGGAGDDYLIGNEGSDHLFGGTGDDILVGLQGNDWLTGYGGGVNERDTLYGSVNDTYSDLFVLGDDSNIFYMDDGFATIKNFQNGRDTLVLSGASHWYQSAPADNGIDTNITRNGSLLAVVEGVTNLSLANQVYV